MTRIAFTTFGCKTNHYDTDAMANACRMAGHDVVSPLSDAEVYVISTCTVTAAADAQGRNLIRRMIRKNPGAKVIVCGCGSEVDAETYKKIEGVNVVLGVRAADKVVSLLCKEKKAEADSPLRQDRARAFLKIQDGCDSRCAYCIVPLARGPQLSVPADRVIRGAQEIAATGFSEIILTGVHIGRYGRDLNPAVTLAGLVEKILAATSEVRIRLSSVDPDEMDDDLKKLFCNPRICRHVHLSLQSGSDKVLRAMNRKEGARKYAGMIREMVSDVPGIAIGADIIAGFPGETDSDFEETVKFVEENPLAYLHVFPYSPRPGTPAAAMTQVPFPIRRARAKKLLEISALKRKSFYEGQLGKRLCVIVVSKGANKRGLMKGVSDNYAPVFFKGSLLKYGDKYEIDVVKSQEDGLYGNLT